MSLTPQQTADQLGVSESTIRKWIRTEELRAVCISKNPNSKKPRFKIEPDAVTEFLQARSTRPPAAVTAPTKYPIKTPTDYVRHYEE